ncbi:MAG: EVE domain-containing protein [Cyanobacteria bacterium]|nr:EVE domain-containing protein [Cyanobacteriota bacterium]
MNYWLMKSEPDCFSIDTLQKEGTTVWDGVRNYQARNIMRDEMKHGDQVLFYHSNAKPPHIAGLAEIASKEPVADPTQFDPKSEYFDEKSSKDNPRWMTVKVKFKKKFKEIIPLEQVKTNPKLKDMMLVQRGSRLSVQPVKAKEWDEILAMVG